MNELRTGSKPRSRRLFVAGRGFASMLSTSEYCGGDDDVMTRALASHRRCCEVLMSDGAALWHRRRL
eukprot:1376252-Rhodomonas_salina.1